MIKKKIKHWTSENPRLLDHVSPSNRVVFKSRKRCCANSTHLFKRGPPKINGKWKRAYTYVNWHQSIRAAASAVEFVRLARSSAPFHVTFVVERGCLGSKKDATRQPSDTQPRGCNGKSSGSFCLHVWAKINPEFVQLILLCCGCKSLKLLKVDVRASDLLQGSVMMLFF